MGKINLEIVKVFGGFERMVKSCLENYKDNSLRHRSEFFTDGKCGYCGWS